MPYARLNTIQVAAVSAAGGAATVKLPNAATGTLPADQTGTIHPIGANSRWRIKAIVASYSALVATGALTITDGVFTWTLDVTTAQPLVLQNLDLQCAAGAEVDVTLGTAGGSLLAHLNVSAVSEG